MSNNCKHIPKNIFNKTLICKNCGKRITFKISYTPIITAFIIVLISFLLKNFILEKFITNIVSKIICFLFSMIISLVCAFVFIRLLGYKEIS